GEPSNTTKSYWNLTGGHNFVDQYNGPAGHTSVQADWAKVFEFWAGRLASGFYIDSASPATNTSWSTLGGLPVSGPPSTPTTPPNVIVPPQTPQFACGSGAGGGSASGAINTMRGVTLVWMVGLGAQKVNTITDTAGDTFSFLAQAFNVGHSRVEAFSANFSNGHVNNQITVANSASGQFCFFYADFNWTLAHGFDVTGTNGTGNSGTCSSSVTTTSANDLVLLMCMVGTATTFTGGASTNVLAQTSASRSTGVANEATTTAGVYSPSMPFTSTTWAALAVAIHPVVIPAAPTGLAAKERS